MLGLSFSPAQAHEGEHHDAPGAKAHGHDAKQAGEAHAHQAPHGGIVRSVGKRHVELVVGANTLSVYVLGDKMKPLPAGGPGKAIVQVPGKGKQTVALAPMKDHLMGPFALKGARAFVAIVSLPVDGKTEVVRFSYPK